MTFYRWLKDTFKLGYNGTITQDQLYSTINSHDSSVLSKKFSTVWKDELTKKSEPNLLRVILKIYGLKIFLLGLGYAFVNTASR